MGMKQSVGEQRRGFTLAELLIVVAIIGILVAVSVPIFSAQTTKAKASTDMANVRSAKAAASAEYMSDPDSYTLPAVFYYDADSGTVTTDEAVSSHYKGYGKSTVKVDNANGIPNNDGTANIVSITVNKDGTYLAKWTDPKAGTAIIGTGSVQTEVNTSNVVQYTTGDTIYSIPEKTITKVGGSYYIVTADWSSTSGSTVTSDYQTWFNENMLGKINYAIKIDTSVLYSSSSKPSGNYFKSGMLYQNDQGTVYAVYYNGYRTPDASNSPVFGSVN